MYLDYVRQNASYFEELSFQKSERFVTLSTCTSDSTNGRHLLVGRIQEEIQKEQGDLQYEKNKQILVFALLFSFLCFPVKQAFAAAGMTEVPLTVKQSFVVENPVKEMDFTGNYEFRALDQEAPMPENTKNGIYSFSLNGEQVETTFSLQYLHAGVYHYQLVQTTAEKERYQYDKSCYEITVYVKIVKMENWFQR